MRAIEKIQEAFSSDRRSITVPEWGGLELWFPPITPAAQQKARQMCRIKEDSVEFQARLFLEMAEYENGEKAFKHADYPTLIRNVDSVVLGRVMSFIFGVNGDGTMPDDMPESLSDVIEEAKAAIDADPT